MQVWGYMSMITCGVFALTCTSLASTMAPYGLEPQQLATMTQAAERVDRKLDRMEEQQAQRTIKRVEDVIVNRGMQEPNMLRSRLLSYFLDELQRIRRIIPENCIAWYDGCNTCSIGEDGQPNACTERYCEAPESPRCLSYERTVRVGHERVDCVGGGNQQCLQVMREIDDAWIPWYDGIDGFVYEPGYEYILRVEESSLQNPPADRLAIQWKLIEVVEKTPFPFGEQAGGDENANGEEMDQAVQEWVRVTPIPQCNPYPYDRTTQSATEFFESKGLTVVDARMEQQMVCSACDVCPVSEYIELLMPREDSQKAQSMLELYQELLDQQGDSLSREELLELYDTRIQQERN